MSPHLFLICMEYLSRLLSICIRDPDFEFNQKCYLIRVTHLAFVDDLLLFDRGDLNSMRIMVGTLEEFTNTSGLKINNEK